jgi:hypothetical protein
VAGAPLLPAHGIPLNATEPSDGVSENSHTLSEDGRVRERGDGWVGAQGRGFSVSSSLRRLTWSALSPPYS